MRSLQIAFITAGLWLVSPFVATAQEAIAIALDGWRQDGKNGVVYYRCASAICAEGSVLSYKFQPHRPGLTLAEFEKHHRALADANRNAGRVRGVEISNPKESVAEGVRILQVDREVDWDDGRHTSTIEARLIGPQRSASVVSDSANHDWSANNFAGFLRSLVPVMGTAAP